MLWLVEWAPPPPTRTFLAGASPPPAYRYPSAPKVTVPMLWLVNWPHQPSTSTFWAVATPPDPMVSRISRPLDTQPSTLAPGPLGAPRHVSLPPLSGLSHFGAV